MAADVERLRRKVRGARVAELKQKVARDRAAFFPERAPRVVLTVKRTMRPGRRLSIGGIPTLLRQRAELVEKASKREQTARELERAGGLDEKARRAQSAASAQTAKKLKEIDARLRKAAVVVIEEGG